MKYIMDMDGVLAEFNSAFAQQLGHAGIPVDDPKWPALWDWPQQYVSDQHLAATWQRVHESATFWESLPPYAWANEALLLLKEEEQRGNEVYFVTARQGNDAKGQTERWLTTQGFAHPTVLICTLHKEKLGIVTDLDADVIIDDRPEVLRQARLLAQQKLRLYLQVHPYNEAFAFIANKRYKILPVESPVTAIRSEYARREIYKEAV